MPRIFAGLAVGQTIVLIAAGVAGFLNTGDPDTPHHVILGLFAVLLGCFVQAVVFTYFTITGKLAAQAVHLAHGDVTLLYGIKNLKRSATFLLAAVFVTLLAATITGAIQWRGDGRPGVHFLTAALAVVVHFYASLRQFRLIVQNGRALDASLRRYREATSQSQRR